MKAGPSLRMILALAAGSLFASCSDALFQNQFANAGLVKAPPPPSAAELSAMPAASLVDQAYTPTGALDAGFLATLTASPAAATAVLATLETAYLDAGATDSEIQQSATLYAQVALETSSAATLVDSLPEVLSALGSGSPDVASLLSSFIPSGFTLADVTDAVTVFSDLGLGALDALGASIDAADISGVPASTIAQAAEVAVIAMIINSIDVTEVTDPSSGLPYGPAERDKLVYDLAQPGSTVVIAAANFTLPGADMTALAGADPSLASLINAAQLGSVVDQLLAGFQP